MLRAGARAEAEGMKMSLVSYLMKDLGILATIFWLIVEFLTLILMFSNQRPSQTRNSEMSCCILRSLEADVRRGTRGR